MKRFIWLLLAVVLTASPAFGSAQNISFLLSQVRTSAGGALVGGKVYFYSAGTTTAKSVWLDKDKQTLAANPYTLDSNATAQLYGDGLYRIVIKDTSGVSRYDRDNIPILGIAWVDINSVGGTLEAAIAAIGPDKCTLVYGSNLAISGDITIPSNIELFPLNGATIKPNGHAFTYYGSRDRWPLAQVFDMSGGGTVSIPNAPHVYPDYWQTNTVPGTTDMLAAYNYAKAANNKVLLTEGTYYITGTLAVDGNRVELSGSSLKSWITKNGNFPAISVTGARNVVSNLTVISTGGDGNIFEIQGATYFDIMSVRVSGSGNGTTFPNNDIAIAYDNTAYGTVTDVQGYNAKTGWSDLGGNNGAVTFVNCKFFTNDNDLDLSGPSNTMIGGTIAHANTSEIKVGTRYATSTVYTTFLRGSLSLTGVHIEGNNTATSPMIVVGDNGSSSIANDVPTLTMSGSRMFLNSANRVPIQYNSGKSLTVNGLSFNGALAGNAGVIQTTTNYALRPTVSGASIGSGAAIPWYSLFATAKGDLIINSDPTNLFTIQSTKPTISVENTANSILDTFRVFTKDGSGNNKERVMVQTGVDTADIKFTGTLKVVGVSNLGTSTFANLGSVPAAGTAVYCTNCTTAATCASGGSGHMAVSNGSNWTCQ